MASTILIPRLMEIGGGAVSRTAAVLSSLGVKRPLVVTDGFLVKSGIVDRVMQPLRAAGIEAGVFADTMPDPTTATVAAGVAALRQAPYDSIIAVGGGSPIDTAKAMALLAANPGEAREYKVGGARAASAVAGLPTVAIPTTAGTGSEATRFTIITDEATEEKMLIAGAHLLPAAAVVDYELTLSCPARLTADTAIDSLTHALEAFVSRKANLFSDQMALAGMRAIAPHIRTAVAEPGNRAARESLMLGATLAGIAFSNASVALVHGMSRPVGAAWHVSHGLSNAQLLPVVTEWSVSGAPSRYATAAREMGVPLPAGADDATANAALVAFLRALNRDLQVPGPKRYGIPREEWAARLPTMAAQALASGSPGNNPRVPSAEEIVALYQRVWAEDEAGSA